MAFKTYNPAQTDECEATEAADVQSVQSVTEKPLTPTVARAVEWLKANPAYGSVRKAASAAGVSVGTMQTAIKTLCCSKPDA